MKTINRLVALALLCALALVPVHGLSEGEIFPGKHVELENGDKIWVSQFGSGEKNLVFFAGFGAYSATFEFIPIIEEINEKFPEYTVYVYEYPGTGYSDVTDQPRTIENIAGEIHDTLEILGVENFTAAVHSISGAYMLYYVNHYPGQVNGLICIDNSVPKQSEVTPYEEMYAYYHAEIERFAATDWDSVNPTDNPEFYFLPDNYDFTDEERAHYLSLVKNSYNPAIIDELQKIEENLKGMIDETFPEELPVLMMVSTESQEGMPEWHDMHEAMVTSDNHTMVIVEGTHYLHYDARDEIVPLIHQFLGEMEP